MKNVPVSSMERLLCVWNTALGSAPFKRRHIDLGDLIRVLPQVRARAFQRLMRALLMEALLDGERMTIGPRCAILELDSPDNALHFEGLTVGRIHGWQLDGEVWLHGPDDDRRKVLFPSTLLSHLIPILNSKLDAKAIERLSDAMDDSFCNDTLCMAYHSKWNQNLQEQAQAAAVEGLLGLAATSADRQEATILLEQWGTLGHPWHPNHKSKWGISTDQVINFSPEFESRMPVPVAAIHLDISHSESMNGDKYLDWWEAQYPQASETWKNFLCARRVDPNRYAPVPVHPLQIDTLRTRFSSEIATGQLILTDAVACIGRASISFRTLWGEGRPLAPMIKLPLAYRLTSASREIAPSLVCMAPRVSRLLTEIRRRDAEAALTWDFVPERFGLHHCSPDADEKSAQLCVIFRDSPLARLNSGELAIPVASLFALDARGEPLFRQWVRLSEQADEPAAVLRFFRRYLRATLPGLLRLLLIYGLTFEAHQQNSFMVMSSVGEPLRLLVRDFADIRIHGPTLHARGLSLTPHDCAQNLFEDGKPVRDELLHAVFICHLGELILLCQRHWPDIDERLLWNAVGSQVKQDFDKLKTQVPQQRWTTERAAILDAPWPAKSLLRMYLADSREDIIGDLANPLHSVDDAA